MKLHFSASSHDGAIERRARLVERYGQHEIADADCIVALGGDGHMLHVLHETVAHDKPVFGLNCGRLGFLMNHYASEELTERIRDAETAPIHPLRMHAETTDGTQHSALAINEVSLIRQTHNAAHIRVEVDGKHQVDELVCDGILLATPVGSTAYNLSAYGPVVPLGAGLMALTPISPFRPRVVRASKGHIAAPRKSSKRPKSPTGHPGALGKVPQSIPQWMFSESISDAFHPGDFPISPRITRGRSTAAPYQPARPRWVNSTQGASAF